LSGKEPEKLFDIAFDPPLISLNVSVDLPEVKSLQPGVFLINPIDIAL
jgi:hypothetical protein